ncbi:hypothetical protein CcaverHIS002_0408180 [Cutaneotrichosporon cavernicola]|nr:hypothetical protein CcaverHIS002_0408180 [Cutaneotrichosporon cavernicola]
MATNTDENTVLAAIQAARNAKQALSEIDDELTMHYDLASLSPRRHAAAATEYTAWEAQPAARKAMFAALLVVIQLLLTGVDVSTMTRAVIRAYIAECKNE